MGEIHEKIITSVDSMISDAMFKLQFYGEFCQFINFKKHHAIPTCGVRVEISGMQFYFNSDFLDTLTQPEMNFIMLHEIFHLLWEHQARTRRCGYDHELSNIVQDMIINEVIKVDIIERMINTNKKENRNLHFADIPVDRETNKIWVLHKPEEYKGELSYEDMYEWIIIEKEKYDAWKEKKEGKCPVSDYLRSIFENMEMGILDWLDIHLPDDIPPEYRRSIIEDIKTILENRNLLTKDIQATIDKITRSKKDYIKNIKIGINELFGTYKQKSITKKNRRSIVGIKGKRKDSYALNVMLDVSGSMEGYFGKALSYILQNDIKLNIIQCDTEVKTHTVVTSKSELRKMKIFGLGGTVLQTGINYIIENKKINKLNTLILTDGETDKIDVRKLKKCMIISHRKKCPIVGDARQIVIK